MGKTLLMFPMSENIGVTINFMSGAVDLFEITRIVFIKILNAPSEKPKDEKDEKDEKEKKDEENFEDELRKTIRMLSKGKYIQDEKEYDVTSGMSYYQKLEQVYFYKFAIETINYNVLKEEIERLSEQYGFDTIVDITGTPKRIAINILAACLSVGMQQVMIFELKKRSEGIDALYHAVKASDNYEFVDLSKESPALRNIANYSEKGNVKRLWGAMIAIAISLGLTIVNQWGSFTSGKGDWIFALIICIGLIGSMVTIIDDLVGGIISAAFDRKK